MKNLKQFTLPAFLLLGMLFWPCLSPTTEAQSQPQQRPHPIDQLDSAPQAVVLSARGNCFYSQSGGSFVPLKAKQVLKEGAVVRIGAESRSDIFFRRIGTSVRLQPGTEMVLEKMQRHLQDGTPVMETLIHLRTGRIFTVVRSFVPGSTFEVRNAAGLAIVEGGGENGRYIITANGTHVADKSSRLPLKVIRETGVTVITPGQTFLAKEGKLLPQAPSEAVLSLIEFDELHTLAEIEAASQSPDQMKK